MNLHEDAHMCFKPKETDVWSGQGPIKEHMFNLYRAVFLLSNRTNENHKVVQCQWHHELMFDVFVFVCATLRWFVCYIHNTRCKVWTKMEPQKLKELWTNGANLVPWERNSHVFVSITERCKTKVPYARFQRFSWFISENDGILINGLRLLGGRHYSLLWIMLIYLCQFFGVGGGHLKKEKRYIKI